MLVRSDRLETLQLRGNSDFPMDSTESTAGQDPLDANKKSPMNSFMWSKTTSTSQIEVDGSPSPMSSLGLDGYLRPKSDIGVPGIDILDTPLPQKPQWLPRM
ncbi:hypothetical protein BGZ50_007891 [Haplosporangium sp. Z 11]|nr:hypothetical protein BGZ50_007891 [Haplosporangium sp. Z 11]